MQDKQLEPLDNLILSYACPVDWSSMEGDERERHCKQCSKTVFNISDLSKKEANEYLQQRSNASHCVKFYLRSDGTITTDDCPRILRPVRNTARFIGRVASGLVGVLIYSVSNFVPLLAKVNDDSKPTSAASIFKNRIDIDLHPKLMFGQTCSDETKDNLKLLFNLNPTNQEEAELLNKIPKDILLAKELQLEPIEKLSTFYEKSNQSDRYFLAQLIKTNIVLSDPTKLVSEIELEQLEKLQLRATDFIVAEADKQLKGGNKKEAEKLIIYSLRLGECGKYMANRKIVYPVKNNRWRISTDVSSVSPVMYRQTLKRVISIIAQLEPDSVLSHPEIEKIELRTKGESAFSTVSKMQQKASPEEMKPEFYKKELSQCPIVVIVKPARKSFTSESEEGLPLRQDCLEVSEVLKAPESFRKSLEQTKFLQGNYNLPEEPPTPVISIHLSHRYREYILLIKSSEKKESSPPYLHCNFGSAVNRTEKTESIFKKWIEQKR